MATSSSPSSVELPPPPRAFSTAATLHTSASANATATTPAAATAASPALSNSTAFEPASAGGGGRFSLDGLRRSLSRLPHDGHTEDERKVSHSARVLYAVITGSIPPSPPPKPKRLSLPAVTKLARRPALPPTVSVVSLATIAEPEVSEVKAKKGLKPTKKKEDSSRPVPNVKPKALKKLKSDLLKADKARAIVADLKRMEVPPEHSPDSCANPAHTNNCRGYALPPLPDPSTDESSPEPVATGKPSNPPFVLLELPSSLSLPPTSVGAIGGLAAAKTGVFEILADASGALIKSSGAHDQLSFAPPFDRISVFVWWWGFEIACPPPAMRFLSSVASVQQSFFQFLSIFVAAGGAPELAPLVKYISSYFDMEFQAIKAQNRGNGVVLAATWLLPVALVPRPWDFPVPSPPRREQPYPNPYPLPQRPANPQPELPSTTPPPSST
ncbi:hypothetical protein JCM6882_005418 [Rhodosporidiobolus microsporus]